MVAHLPSALNRFVVDSRRSKNKIIPEIKDFCDDPISVKSSIILPFNLDAEFVDNLPKSAFSSEKLGSRKGVTVQIRGITESKGWIFAHPNLVDERPMRHPVIDSPCVVQDWLQANGIDCEFYYDLEQYAKIKKSCRLQLCAHFALADVLFLAGSAEFEQTLVDLYRRKKLTMSRRLVAKSSGHHKARSGIAGLYGWLFRIGDMCYRVSLEIIDTSGLHGVVSYQELAANVGVKLDAKDLISRTGENADITRMDEIYFERPTDYDEYALGDLYVSDIIRENDKLWREIWNDLGIGHLFTGTKLTVGTSVACLIKARISQLLDMSMDDPQLVDLTTGTHNANHLSKLNKAKNALCLLSKVDGGRCRNAKPIITKLVGALCDIDIGGAYASSMTATPLILGKPREVYFGNVKDSRQDLKDCPSLAEFLRRHEHRLVERAWFARVSTKDPFTFENDLIPSWINWRAITTKTDSEVIGLDVLTDPASGEMRYFSREIWSGTLTSDLLDVARCTMSPAQYREWSNKIVVRACLYVNCEDRLSIEDFSNHVKADTLPEHAWTSATLGELVSDVARSNRMKYKKNTPLNTLYKLVSNTVYGDSVSRHFATSSVISGSNVTATVRAFMYLVEKGLNLVGSITDGQLFDLNKVLQPRVIYDKRTPHITGNRRPSDLAINTRVYQLSNRELKNLAKCQHGSLIGQKIETSWNGDHVVMRIDHGDHIETLQDDAAITLIDQAAFDHLVKLWPKCKLLTDDFRVVTGSHPDGSVRYETQKGIFRFETKPLISQAVCHGTANYWYITTNPGDQKGPKMRSFEDNRQHFAFTIDDSGEIVELNTYKEQNPARVLLGAILENPSKVPILPPFLKSRILKPGIYQTQSKYKSDGVVIAPGDSIWVMGRPRLFSLSQYTFQSRQQYDAWRKATNRLTNKTGVSFEAWFIDSDGVVDYRTLTREIDLAITNGVTDPVKHFDGKHRRNIPEIVVRYHLAGKKMKTQLNDMVDVDAGSYETIKDDAGFGGREWD